MKETLTIILIFFSPLYANEIANIRIHTQEIILDDQKLSTTIFQKLNVPTQRFDQVISGYKLGKYTYCRTHINKLRCYLYLSLDLDGSLSSPWTDSDFGKGDAIDYIYTKTVPTKADYLIESDHVFIWFHGNSAQTIFNKIVAAKTKYDEKKREIRQGKHIVCALDKENRYACFIKLPLNDQKDFNQEPSVIWALI
jgi:hypothetical protein